MPGDWRAVGMQRLIDVVRASGATQPIIVDGLQWANDLSGWIAAQLRDPLRQLVAGFHVYSWNSCSTPTCWNATVATVATSVPVIATEVGEKDCNANFVSRFLNWSHTHEISSLVWTWNDNEGCLSLLAAPSSDPTAYGKAIKGDFLTFALERRGAD